MSLLLNTPITTLSVSTEKKKYARKWLVEMRIESGLMNRD